MVLQYIGAGGLVDLVVMFLPRRLHVFYANLTLSWIQFLDFSHDLVHSAHYIVWWIWKIIIVILICTTCGSSNLLGIKKDGSLTKMTQSLLHINAPLELYCYVLFLLWSLVLSCQDIAYFNRTLPIIVPLFLWRVLNNASFCSSTSIWIYLSGQERESLSVDWKTNTELQKAKGQRVRKGIKNDSKKRADEESKRHINSKKDG